MEAILWLLVAGLIFGGLARLAVPGPDPMPLWLTIAFGVAGSLVGGGIASQLVGEPESSGEAGGAAFAVLLAALVVTTLGVIGYRRIVQRRGITGPEARRPPVRGFGIRRRSAGEDPGGRLRQLNQLRDDGLISEAEFDAKRRDVLERL